MTQTYQTSTTAGTDMVPVAIYARFSTDKQNACSIADQFRRCREFATRHGYEVVAKFADEAVSGAHANRDQLREMLRVATASSQSPFRAVIVDDLSRLSRDIGDTHVIIFRELAGAGVKVLDTGGLDSASDSGEMTVAMRSIINREYIRAVSKQTHRGLTGRALAGFSTGGSLYGYRTFGEPNPTDTEHPRKEWRIYEPEAAMVRRIFDLYDAGAASYKSIADTLNREGIRAPRDGRRGNKTGRGWNHTSVRSILLNPKYIGEWVWNANAWTRISGKAKRRARPIEEHVTKQMPELAIVSRAVWDRVQSRMTRQHRGRGRPPGAGSHAYLVSGLLKCGTCGGSMSINGVKIKAGVRYASFACTANRSRGSSICPNSASISERKITAALVNALRETLSVPDIADSFVSAFERRVQERQSKPTREAALARQLRDAETRVKNVTTALARMPDSEALYAQLRSDEAAAKRLRADLARLRSPAVPRSTPSRAVVRANIGEFLDAIATEAPERGRELLARVMTPLTLIRNEKAPGTWSVTGAIRLRTLAAGVSANFSSGGRIRCLNNVQSLRIVL